MIKTKLSGVLIALVLIPAPLHAQQGPPDKACTAAPQHAQMHEKHCMPTGRQEQQQTNAPTDRPIPSHKPTPTDKPTPTATSTPTDKPVQQPSDEPQAKPTPPDDNDRTEVANRHARLQPQPQATVTVTETVTAVETVTATPKPEVIVRKETRTHRVVRVLNKIPVWGAMLIGIGAGGTLTALYYMRKRTRELH